jgi:hypothetical protein
VERLLAELEADGPEEAVYPVKAISN